MSNEIYFYRKGDHVDYNGQDAVVKGVHYASKTITIEVNGQQYTVDANDLFGINENDNPYQGCESYCEDRIATAQAEYEERSQKSRFALEECYNYKETAAHIKKSMNNLLGDCSLAELSNSKKNQYTELEKNYKRNLKISWKNNTIFEINNSFALECAYEINDWKHQLALVKTMKRNSVFLG